MFWYSLLSRFFLSLSSLFKRHQSFFVLKTLSMLCLHYSSASTNYLNIVFLPCFPGDAVTPEICLDLIMWSEWWEFLFHSIMYFGPKTSNYLFTGLSKYCVLVFFFFSIFPTCFYSSQLHS